MIKKILNTTIEQPMIIIGIAVLILLYGVVGEIVSLDKLASFPYFIISVVTSCLMFVYRNRIKLFSPYYVFFIAFFFVMMLSPFYYFSSPYDIWKMPRLNNSDLMTEISIINLIFSISVIIPILFDMHFDFKIKKYKIPVINKENINISFAIILVSIIGLLIAMFASSGMSPIDILLNPMGFRYSFVSGLTSHLRRFILLLFYFSLTILMFNHFKKQFQINKFLIVIFWILFLYFGLGSGSRSIFVYSIFYYLMIYTFYRKIKIKSLLAGGIFLLILLLFNSIYLQYRNIKYAASLGNYAAVEKQINNKGLKLFSSLAERNDSFVNNIHFFDWYKKEYHVESILTSNPNNIVEQSLFHCTAFFTKKQKEKLLNRKGATEFSIVLSDKVFPGAYISKVSYEFGAIVNSYWNFGLLGVIVLGFLYGLFIVLSQKLFDLYLDKSIFLIFYFNILYMIIDGYIKIGFINTTYFTLMPLSMIFLLLICTIFYSRIKIKI